LGQHAMDFEVGCGLVPDMPLMLTF
jgi:hypothetical protein